MCGICGIIKFDNSPPESGKIQNMMKLMKHRGPDDEGVFFENNVGLGFVRLSILDLSPLGHQPMFGSRKAVGSKGITNGGMEECLNDGRYVIVYNGEVYNYLELREELKSKGYEFKSNTDTEVVLNAFIEWGEDCLNKFNGMWAFAIYDRENSEIFIARDRFGIKPFYYYLDEHQLIFASEIPPILSIIKEKPKANNQAVFDYLVFNRTDQTEQTFFEGIKKLQHGQILKLRNDEWRLASEKASSGIIFQSKINNYKLIITRWYDLREKVKSTSGFSNAAEYRELLSDAIGLRLRSDVQVGVCLSGGLDSSSIVSVLLKDYNFDSVKTFSAVYGKGVVGDESDYIHLFSTKSHSANPSLRNMHFITPDAQVLFNDLDRFITAHGEPIPSTSPYAQFKVMKLAKENVVVTLDGQGADEELAGYHYFFGFYFKDLLKQLRFLKFVNEIKHYFVNHRSLYGLKTFFYFLLPNKYKTSLRVKEKGYLTPEFYDNNSHSVIANELYSSISLKDALFNHFEYKLEHLLKWEDRNSMHFSLEARVPFLDFRLVEKTLATNSEMIINKGMTKHILREAMKNYLPEKIRTRKDKIGFATPQDEWFRTIIFEKIIKEILASKSFNQRNIVDSNKALVLYQKHLAKKINISKEIWKWINLEFWFRKFID